MAVGEHHSARMKSDTWLTPPAMIEELGPFDLDPCTPPEMPWRTATKRYTEADDGLACEWRGRVWLNPPYSREVARWLKRMTEHGTGTALLFARTETSWFHRYIWREAAALLFLEGRINFHLPDGMRAKANAGAPSVLIAYGSADADRLAECSLAGAFVPLGCLGQSVLVLRHDDGLTWRELLRRVTARQERGRITLAVAYALVRDHPKARRNPNWQAKVRQTLQQQDFKRTGPGQYVLDL